MNMNMGVTPAQGRVLFHQDRLFRSTGSGTKAHRVYVDLCADAGLPTRVDQMDHESCVDALQLMEQACREAGLHNFRDVSTGWQKLEAA